MRDTILSRFKFVILGVAALAVLSATGCTSNRAPSTSTVSSTTNTTFTPTTTTTPATTTPTNATLSPYTIHIASKAIIGNYLADPRGKTLYYTTSDLPGYSNLPDETLSTWPVFYVENITVPPSLKAADFGTYTRDNNVKQTTYRGYPLYYFYQDIKSGDTFGNKLNGVWFVVDPDNFPP